MINSEFIDATNKEKLICIHCNTSKFIGGSQLMTFNVTDHVNRDALSGGEANYYFPFKFLLPYLQMLQKTFGFKLFR